VISYHSIDVLHWAVYVDCGAGCDTSRRSSLFWLRC